MPDRRIERGVPAERLDVRPAAVGDLPYVRSAWRECYHLAPQRRRLPWSAFKLIYGTIIDDLLAREDVWILGAYDAAGLVRGWIAWTPGAVPVVHYLHVRHDDRGRGIARRLIDAAELGPRLVYTFRGVKPKRQDSLDHALVASLGRRGIAAVYVPIREFMGRAPARAADNDERVA